MAIPTPAITNLPEQPKDAKLRGVPQVNVTSMKSRGVVSQPEDRWRTRPAELPFLMEHDILKVTNHDTVDWMFKWDRRRYLVKVGETGFVPFPALVIKMGDPRSVEGAITRFNTEDGTRGIIATRYDTLVTLFAHYGIEQENVAELVDFAPKLEIRTMADDIVVSFPSQNPNMPPWPVPQVPAPGRENSDQRRMLDNMSAENRAMREELAEMRAMIGQRLDPPVGRPDPATETQGTEPDPLAAALSGATVDQGPSSQLR